MSVNTANFRVATALSIPGATTQSLPAPVEMQGEADVYIKVTAAGTTMIPIVETSPDDGVSWFTNTTLAAITATGNVLTKIPSNIGKLMRINFTAVTGTFTVDAWIIGKRIS